MYKVIEFKGTTEVVLGRYSTMYEAQVARRRDIASLAGSRGKPVTLELWESLPNDVGDLRINVMTAEVVFTVVEDS
jgi:hypothetical protein